MTLELEALGFTGFYQGIWDQGENEYRETRDMKYGEYDDIEDLQLLDDWGFSLDYRDNIAKLYAETYIEHINDIFGIDLKLVGQWVRSPKYYNFTTDEIYCKVEIDDLDKLVNHLRELCNDPRYKEDIIETIKQNHASCDGFISYMSNDFEDWMDCIADPDDDRYISCLIGYLVNAIAPGSLRELNTGVYSWASEQGYQMAEPQTKDAKDEWELYLKYRGIYTEYTREHPICHPDPNRPGYHTMDDWDDYKERFMEYAEAYEAEQKRKAALAAQPVIPGLFDDDE